VCANNIAGVLVAFDCLAPGGEQPFGICGRALADGRIFDDQRPT
jgi:hypothetical protein